MHKAAQHDRTFENGLRWGHVLNAIHGGPESVARRSLLSGASNQFHISSFDIVSFVEGRFVRFVRACPSSGSKKSLSQITGAFEALIEAMQAHQDLTL